jgi:hypothetical protein
VTGQKKIRSYDLLRSPGGRYGSGSRWGAQLFGCGLASDDFHTRPVPAEKRRWPGEGWALGAKGH